MALGIILGLVIGKPIGITLFASATGASGSPVYDANGQVVAVLFGGNPRAERPVLYAVPASAIAALITGR